MVYLMNMCSMFIQPTYWYKFFILLPSMKTPHNIYEKYSFSIIQRHFNLSSVVPLPLEASCALERTPVPGPFLSSSGACADGEGRRAGRPAPLPLVSSIVSVA